MRELHLPHQEPIKFAKHILSKSDAEVMVKAEFATVPTLPMLTEAAAQASGAFSDAESKMGFLVSLKNVKLLEKPTLLEYRIKLLKEHELGSMSYFSFEVIDGETLVARGVFIIAIEQ